MHGKGPGHIGRIGVAALAIGALACGTGSPDSDPLSPEQLTAGQVENLLSLPNGGFEFKAHSFGFDVDPLDEQARAIAGLLGEKQAVDSPRTGGQSRPPHAQDCPSGLVHGKWQPLERGVGVLMGAVHDANLELTGRLGGIFGGGRLFGIVVSAAGNPSYLVSGSYSRGRFEANLLDERMQVVGHVNGLQHAENLFVGLWNAKCVEPQPACVTRVSEPHRPCQTERAWRRELSWACERDGRVLLGFVVAGECLEKYSDAGIIDADQRWQDDASWVKDDASWVRDDASWVKDDASWAKDDASWVKDDASWVDGGAPMPWPGHDAGLPPGHDDGPWRRTDAGPGPHLEPAYRDAKYTCCHPSR